MTSRIGICIWVGYIDDEEDICDNTNILPFICELVERVLNTVPVQKFEFNKHILTQQIKLLLCTERPGCGVDVEKFGFERLHFKNKCCACSK